MIKLQDFLLELIEVKAVEPSDHEESVFQLDLLRKVVKTMERRGTRPGHGLQVEDVRHLDVRNLSMQLGVPARGNHVLARSATDVVVPWEDI